MAKRPSPKPKAPREIELKPERKQPSIPASRAVRFGEVIGQERAIATLRDSVRAGRIHHAWILHGPPGVGKFTTALAFAGLILDPTSQPNLSGEIEPEAESPTRRLLAAGTHPDLRIVTKELARISREAEIRDRKLTNIPIDVVREFLIEPAERSGSASGGALASKVFIVDEAELLNHGVNAAQNALLKTLEEPPPGCVIILVTSQEERLLPTIRSRSQRVPFTPLSEEPMRRWLKSSGLDLSGLDTEGVAWLLSFAAGSPGTAKLALETGLVAWHRAVEPMLDELDRGRFPVDFGTVADTLADQWAEAWVKGRENASKEAANRAAARQMLRLIAEHYRRAMRAGPGGNAKGLERGARAVELVVGAERQAEGNVNLMFVLDNLGAQLALSPRG
ncbi:MAG: DNA polymerase III subunit [Phycisphaerales bacterium]